MGIIIKKTNSLSAIAPAAFKQRIGALCWIVLRGKTTTPSCKRSKILHCFLCLSIRLREAAKKKLEAKQLERQNAAVEAVQ